MKDIQKSMKLSLIFGLLGAVGIPIIYEIYANISIAAGLFLAVCYTLAAGVIFSGLAMKSALLGITVCLAYNGILGMIAYVVIHPAMVGFLNSHSEYFQLSLKEQLMFLIYVAVILLCMYLVCFVRKGFGRAYNLFKSNREKTGAYIEDAFSDSGDIK